MHLSNLLPYLTTALLTLGAAPTFAKSPDSSPTFQTEIFYQPFSSSPKEPSLLAQISYDPSTLQSTVISYTPPDANANENDNANEKSSDLVRVGLFTDTDSNARTISDQKHWVGTLTSLSSFSPSTSSEATAPSPKSTLTLYLDEDSRVYHVGLSSSSDNSESKLGGDFGLNVEFVRAEKAPVPYLNRPIVKGPDGTEPEEVVEKSALQKYWWLIPIVLFVGMSGGGG